MLNKGDRLKMCHYCGWTRAARRLLSQWSLRLFLLQWISVEEDFLRGKAFFEKVAIKKKHVAEVAEAKSTDVAISSAEVKVLRGAAVNNVVVGLMLLSDPHHRRVCASMVHAGRFVEAWQAEHVRECKGTTGSSRWLTAEIGHRFNKHLCDTVAVLNDYKSLDDIRFFDGVTVDGVEMAALQSEDDMAMFFAKTVLKVVAMRARRLCYLTEGLPGRCFRFLVDDLDVEKETILEFKEDAVAHGRLLALERKSAILQRFMDRSAFNLTATDMWSAAVASSENNRCPRGKGMAKTFSLAILSSVPVENVHNMQKNSGQLRGCARKRRPQSAYAVAIGTEVLEKRDGFKYLPPATGVLRKTQKLNRLSYGFDSCEPSCDFSGIASLQQKTSWFSPKPGNLCKPAGDLIVSRNVPTENMEYVLPRLFLGFFANMDHGIMIRTGQIGDGGVDWEFPLYHIEESAFFSWPAKLVTVQQDEVDYWTLDTKVVRIPGYPMNSWDGRLARRIAWRSPAWQRAKLKDERFTCQPAVRPFAVGPELPLAQVAAEEAYWAADVTTLRKISREFQLDVPQEGSEFETCFSMVKGVLGGSDTETMERMRHRLGKSSPLQAASVEILMEVDEAMQCLEKEDEERLRKEIVDSAKADERKETYRQVWTEKMKQVRAEAERAAAPAGRKKKPRRDEPPRRWLPDQIDLEDQQMLKSFMPEGGYLWKSRATSTWNARWANLPSHARSALKHGDQAWRIVVSLAWKDWCEVHGVHVDDCPMRNLILDEPQA